MGNLSFCSSVTKKKTFFHFQMNRLKGICFKKSLKEQVKRDFKIWGKLSRVVLNVKCSKCRLQFEVSCISESCELF